MNVGCTIKSLPPRLHEVAAEVALKINPANAPDGSYPLRIGVMRTKFWGGTPRVLTVAFMEATTVALADRILSHMNAWGCCIAFERTSDVASANVRISREGLGYWSYLGTDIIHIPASQPTMNLEGFTMDTPDSEFYRVVRHETGHCLHGDTMVDCPRDLDEHPLGIPIRDLVGKQPWVYAWKDGKIVIRKASRVWMSKQNAEVIRVRLQPGRGPRHRQFLPPQELVGTPDHLVLLSDGETWKKLGELRPGDRLCSLYRQSGGERPRIQWTGSDRIREHVFVCQELYGPRPEGCDAHHRNERKLDQSPHNLEWKEESLHHSDHSTGRRDTPETRAKRIEANIGRTHTLETRIKMSESARYRPPISEETRRKISEASKGRPQSPETIAKRMEAMRDYYENGGRSGMFGKTASEETRAKRSASMKETLARKRAMSNHVVVSIEPAGFQDVYDMTVPDADSFVANGVVVHNSLGFPHEHMRRDIVARIDPARAYQYFELTQGWSAQTVSDQVLTPLDEASIYGTPADQTSIMCYQLPGSITIDGMSIVGGLDLNASDRALAALIYPLPGASALVAAHDANHWPESMDVPVGDLLTA